MSGGQDEGSEIFAAAMAKQAAGDVARARRLLHRAAALDHLPALQQYADFVAQGLGGKPNPTRALRWLERAAKQGDRAAAMRLGRWYAAQGNDGLAKHWLWKVRDPYASFLLVKLYAKSRSVRATDRAKRLLAHAVSHAHQFSDAERVELAALEQDFSRRTPDAIWAPNNRVVAGRLRQVDRTIAEVERRKSQYALPEPASPLEWLVRAVREFF